MMFSILRLVLLFAVVNLVPQFSYSFFEDTYLLEKAISEDNAIKSLVKTDWASKYVHNATCTRAVFAVRYDGKSPTVDFFWVQATEEGSKVKKLAFAGGNWDAIEQFDSSDSVPNDVQVTATKDSKLEKFLLPISESLDANPPEFGQEIFVIIKDSGAYAVLVGTATEGMVRFPNAGVSKYRCEVSQFTSFRDSFTQWQPVSNGIFAAGRRGQLAYSPGTDEVDLRLNKDWAAYATLIDERFKRDGKLRASNLSIGKIVRDVLGPSSLVPKEALVEAIVVRDSEIAKRTDPLLSILQSREK